MNGKTVSLDFTMQELTRLSWDAMDEEQRKLITDVQNIKRMCMSRVESLFVQHYHDAGIDDLPKLVEKCNKYTDGSYEILERPCNGAIKHLPLSDYFYSGEDEINCH